MADDTGSTARQRRKDEGPLPSNGHVPLPNATTSSLPNLLEISPANTSRSLILTLVPILTLILFGCCSNVYTLESLINTSPTTGPLLTFTQFLLVSLFSSRSCLRTDLAFPFIHLRDRVIPITKWTIYTILFVTINLLNNAAFGYQISIPLHIILRSAGPVTSMGVSYLFAGKRYPRSKILAVALLFSGVVLAALSDSYSKAPKTTSLKSTSTTEPQPSTLSVLAHQAPGFTFLFLALLLSAILGLYTDKLYTTHGRSHTVTAESLFYSHTLSLPLFALRLPALQSNFISLINASQPLSTSLALNNLPLPLGPTSRFHQVLMYIPTALIMLLLNALTQCICISGVNRLAATSSSLTVSIVLNIRKLVSLLLSIWLFGNRLPTGVMAGAGLVFLGGGLYALPSGKVQDRPRVDGRKKNADGVEEIDGMKGKKEL